LTIIEVDFLKAESLQIIPKDIDISYYLINSMSTQSGDFGDMEEICATNFKNCIEQTKAKQVIYLSEISNNKRTSISRVENNTRNRQFITLFSSVENVRVKK
jgi:hypothetical protein